MIKILNIEKILEKDFDFVTGEGDQDELFVLNPPTIKVEEEQSKFEY